MDGFVSQLTLLARGLTSSWFFLSTLKSGVYKQLQIMKSVVMEAEHKKSDNHSLSTEKFVFLVHNVYKVKGTSKVPKNIPRAEKGMYRGADK